MERDSSTMPWVQGSAQNDNVFSVISNLVVMKCLPAGRQGDLCDKVNCEAR